MNHDRAGGIGRAVEDVRVVVDEDRIRIAADRRDLQHLRFGASRSDARQRNERRRSSVFDQHDRIRRLRSDGRRKVHVDNGQNKHLGDERRRAVGDFHGDVRGSQLVRCRIEDQHRRLQCGRRSHAALREVHRRVRNQCRVVAGGRDRQRLRVEIAVRDARHRHRVHQIAALVDRGRSRLIQGRQINHIGDVDRDVSEELGIVHRFIDHRVGIVIQHAVEAGVFHGDSHRRGSKQTRSRCEPEHARRIRRRVIDRQVRDQSRNRTGLQRRSRLQDLRFAAARRDPGKIHGLLARLFQHSHRRDCGDGRQIVHRSDVDHDRLECHAVIEQRAELPIQAGVHDLDRQRRRAGFEGDRLVSDDGTAAPRDSRSRLGEVHQRIGNQRRVVAGHGDGNFFLSRECQRLERPRVDAGQIDNLRRGAFQDVEDCRRSVHSRRVIDRVHNDVERSRRRNIVRDGVRCRDQRSRRVSLQRRRVHAARDRERTAGNPDDGHLFVVDEDVEAGHRRESRGVRDLHRRIQQRRRGRIRERVEAQSSVRAAIRHRHGDGGRAEAIRSGQEGQRPARRRQTSRGRLQVGRVVVQRQI